MLRNVKVWNIKPESRQGTMYIENQILADKFQKYLICLVKALTYTYTYDIINISDEGGKTNGQEKKQKEP